MDRHFGRRDPAFGLRPRDIADALGRRSWRPLSLSGAQVLAKSIGGRLIHALGMLRKQGRLLAKGRSKAAVIWDLPSQKTLV